MFTALLMAEISVIMPAYNAELYIEASIISVISQTYKNWELLIINDGSTDSTQAIAEKYCLVDERIRVINQKNKGLGGARNVGIAQSIGAWIAFLDSDDLWEKIKLEKQIEIAYKHPGVDVIYTDGSIVYNNCLHKLEPYPTLSGSFSSKEMYKMLYKANYIPVLSVLAKKKVIKEIGFQEESRFFYGCEDWDYWLRMARNGSSFFGMEEKLFYYRRHGSNMSKDEINMRFAKASVFIKNFEAGNFDENEVLKIFRPLIYHLIIDLLCLNRKDDILYLLKGIENIHPMISSKMIKVLIFMFGKGAYYPVRFINHLWEQ